MRNDNRIRGWVRFITVGRGSMAILLLSILCLRAVAVDAVEIREVRQPPRHQWKDYMKVAGQPEPVPVEWVSTPEGQYAHSIVIPNPLPKDSGYKWWWSAKQYHQHLCEREAGEFIFKTAENVAGFLFLRPPRRPSDYDLMDARKLEAPAFERGFGTQPHIGQRGSAFVWKGRFSYVEEPASASENGMTGYLYASGPVVPPRFWLRDIKTETAPVSLYGITWRGILRYKDRRHAIAGHEIIVLDLQSNEVLAVARDYGISGSTPGRRDGIWWLNAPACQKFSTRYTAAGKQHLVDFVMKVLRPVSQSSKELENVSR